MSVKFPHIILRPKTEQELADPEFMRDLAIKKMSGIRPNGDEAATSQDRKDLLIALSRVHDITKWVEVIGIFCVIAPVFEQVVKEDGTAPSVTSVTLSTQERRVAALVRARAAKAEMLADGRMVMKHGAKRTGVDYGDKPEDGKAGIDADTNPE